MTPSTLVFLGPSRPERGSPTEPDWVVLPPVRRGDIPSLLTAMPEVRRLAVIDGEFGQSLSVSITELRAALSAGVEVWGASSMGALRAAECSVLGMRGVGWVHRMYATGRIEADDEVALLYDPDTGRSLTLPLVNVRWAISLAVRHGRLGPSAGAALLEVARSLHFEDRTWPAVERTAPPRLTYSARLLAEFAAGHPWACDRKALDAGRLLARLSRRSPEPILGR